MRLPVVLVSPGGGWGQCFFFTSRWELFPYYFLIFFMFWKNFKKKEQNPNFWNPKIRRFTGSFFLRSKKSSHLAKTNLKTLAVGTGFASNTRCGQKYAESTGMDRMCFILLSFDSPENFRYRKSMCPKSSGFGKMKLLGESSIGFYGVKSVTIIAQP